MRTPLDILAAYKATLRRKFYDFVGGAKPPEGVPVPKDPTEALILGMRIGRGEGYGEGLVEGTELGLDVGLEAMDEMLNVPVVFGPTDTALS